MHSVTPARVSCQGWTLPVVVADGFRQRLTGLRGTTGRVGLLIRARSVHGFGMDRPLLVIGLDREHKVVGSSVLRPNRVVTFPRARHVLEVPIELTPPPIGTRVVVDLG